MTDSSASLLLVLAVLLPFTGVTVGLLLGGRHVRTVALTTVALGLAVVGGIVWHALGTGSGSALEYVLGAWSPPLGIRLRADGLSVLMLLAVAFVISLVRCMPMRIFPPTRTARKHAHR